MLTYEQIDALAVVGAKYGHPEAYRDAYRLGVAAGQAAERKLVLQLCREWTYTDDVEHILMQKIERGEDA